MDPTMTIKDVRQLPALCPLKVWRQVTGESLRHLQLEAQRGKLPYCVKVGGRYMVNTSKALADLGLGE